ncbi:MAG: hypothetical protein WCC48_07715 [Anaeromyxobacteraceae bacterium]
MTKTLKLTLAVVPLLLAVACTDPNKLPAETAIKAAEAATATFTAEVTKFAPEQVKAFQDELAAAKAAVAKQDWKGARATAETLPAKAAQVVAAATAQKEALQKAVEAGVAKIGETLTAVQARVDELSKAKKLPAGITKDAVEKAKESAAELGAAAAKLKDEAGADVGAAAAKAAELAAKATELANSIQVP